MIGLAELMKTLRETGASDAVRTLLDRDPAARANLHVSDGGVLRGRTPPGHASTEITQVYTLLADRVADTEIRAARRKRDTGRR